MQSVRWRAPGRLNLIGEHTDYNGGFALPFAIEQGCTATVTRRAPALVELRSAQLGDAAPVALDALHPGRGGWAGYAHGVVWELRRRGHRVPGLRIELDSTVPPGSGLSSSAALVCSVATALDDLLGLRLSADELLAVTRAAENDYVGAPTGGMDQLAALRCTRGHALFCDMRSLETEPVRVDLDAAGLAILVVDTRAGHRHADGEYRRRRRGCERAAALLGLSSLRELPAGDLDAALARLDDDQLRRYTRHVVTENGRVLHAVRLLRAGRLVELGPLLSASHASLRDEFRVSVPELDVAADTLQAAGAAGARLVGGGFGGCVLALLDAPLVPGATAAVTEAYARRGWREPVCFTVHPSEGAEKLVL